MKATVLLTVKNNAKTIKFCIDSLLKQTFKDFNIFVVDAFSTDGTYEILKSYANKILLFQKEGSAPVGFNYGIDKIYSEFTAFTDGDCIADRDWLANLLKGFKTDDIIATAGYCGTYKVENKLQKIIGIELEDRFKAFPKYLYRAPTMNLCVRTKVLKETKFNEKYPVAFETDLGYRLSDRGRIAYVKNAEIRHFHRASWKGFFKQQFNYGRYHFLVSTSFKKKIYGDHISNFYMLMQIPAFYLVFLTLPLNRVLSLFIMEDIFLVALFKMLSMRLTWKDLKAFMLFYFVRLTAWCFGLVGGIYLKLKEIL